MGQKYESISKGYCKDTANYLYNAFSFSYSPEGGTFWNQVAKRLEALGEGKNFDTPIPILADMTTLIATENKRIVTRIVQLNEEIARQADTINELRRKLLIADFANMAGSRGSGRL